MEVFYVVFLFCFTLYIFSVFSDCFLMKTLSNTIDMDGHQNENKAGGGIRLLHSTTLSLAWHGTELHCLRYVQSLSHEMVILDKLHHIETHFHRWLNTLEGGEDSSLTVLPDDSVLNCKTGCHCFGVQHLNNEPSSSTESVSKTHWHPKMRLSNNTVCCVLQSS